MNALVTGGAGFIGSNVARLLLDRGADVVILDDLSSGYRENLEFVAGARFVEGDIRDPAAVADAIKDCEVVFHLAASVGNTRSIDNPRRDAEINLIGTLEVLEAARRSDVRRIVYSSSAGIFGELMTLPIAADHPIAPLTPYGVSKLAAEKACLAYADLYDLQAVCLRYFNVYGLGQRYDAYGNVIPIFARGILQDSEITIHGDGTQSRDFINVGDVAEANFLAGTVEAGSGVFNLGSGTRIPIKELANLMLRLTGADADIVHGPTRPGDVLHSLADIEPARTQLGFSPAVTIEDGLAEYLSWFRGQMDSR